MGSRINPIRLISSLLRPRLTTWDEISEMFNPTTNRKREKIFELIKEKLERALKSKVGRRIQAAKGFYTLEIAPPKINELEKLKADLELVKEFFQSGCYKYLTVRQAWLLLLVGTEVALWFFLGETIGKFHIVGYKV